MQMLHACFVCTAVRYTDAPLAAKNKVYEQIMVSTSVCVGALHRATVIKTYVIYAVDVKGGRLN